MNAIGPTGRYFLNALVPAPKAASPFILAAGLLVPRKTGIVEVFATVNASDLTPATILAVLQSIENPTGISGGVNIGGVYLASALAAPGLVSVQGGAAPVLQAGADQSSYAGTGGTNVCTLPIATAISLQVGVPYALQLALYTLDGLTDVGLPVTSFFAVERT